MCLEVSLATPLVISRAVFFSEIAISPEISLVIFCKSDIASVVPLQNPLIIPFGNL